MSSLQDRRRSLPDLSGRLLGAAIMACGILAYMLLIITTFYCVIVRVPPL